MLQAECVVVGYDDHFNYARLSRALAYLQNKQCLFVATNTDPTYPSDEGYVLPGLYWLHHV
jgi:ribonucleotide monophosphatase NagD (HAD superfamily)